MARITPIRLTKNDRKEYNRLAKNSKAKVKRALKNGVDISDELELPRLEEFETRSEFNQWKKKQKQFSDRKNKINVNEYGVGATDQLIKEITKNTKKAQKTVDKLIKEAENKPFISGGKVVGTQAQELLKMKDSNPAGFRRPHDFVFGSIKNKKRLREIENNMEKRASGQYYDERMERMRSDYIEELEKAFNSDAYNLADRLRNMPIADFYELYKMFKEFDFQVFYLMRHMEHLDHTPVLRQLESYVDRYEEQGLNPLFGLRFKKG